MDCRTAESMINGYINRNLPLDELEEFIRHVKSCPSCYDELETYFVVNSALQHLDDEHEEKNLDMHRVLELDLKERQAHVRKLHRRRIIFSCMMLFLILFVVGLAGYLLGGMDFYKHLRK